MRDCHTHDVQCMQHHGHDMGDQSRVLSRKNQRRHSRVHLEWVQVNVVACLCCGTHPPFGVVCHRVHICVHSYHTVSYGCKRGYFAHVPSCHSRHMALVSPSCLSAWSFGMSYWLSSRWASLEGMMQSACRLP